MERLNTTVGVFEGQDKGSDSFIIAEFKPTEADFFVSAGCIRVEEIGLIDKELVFNSINEVRVDGFLKVLQRFKIGDLLESKEIIVEEIDSGWRPTNIAIDDDPDGLSIDRCKGDGDETVADCVRDLEEFLDADVVDTIQWVLKVERCNVFEVNWLDLDGIEGDWRLPDLDTNELLGRVVSSSPSQSSCAISVAKRKVSIGLIKDWAEEELAYKGSRWEIVNVVLALPDIDRVDSKVVVIVFSLEFHAHLFIFKALAILEDIVESALRAILTQIRDTTSSIGEADTTVKEVPNITPNTDSIDSFNTGISSFLTPSKLIEEVSFSTSDTHWGIFALTATDSTASTRHNAFPNWVQYQSFNT